MFATSAKPPRLVVASLTVLASTVLTACTTVSLAVANFPAVFGSYEVRRDIEYGSLDRQALDVYVPNDGATKQTSGRPIVVFIHGGGWTSGSKNDYRFVAEALTSRGYIAVVANYRLYPEVKFPDFVDDVARAVAWTHSHASEFGGDNRRLFLMGHSAGAQISAMLAFNPEYLNKVGADRSWLRGFIGLAGPYDFLPFKDEYLKDVFGPESRYPLSQPVNFVTDNAVPALLIHGEPDDVVWLKNSKSLAAKLRAHGDRVVERYYPEMTHTGVLKAFSVYFRGRQPVLGEIDSFIRETSGAVRASSP